MKTPTPPDDVAPKIFPIKQLLLTFKEPPAPKRVRIFSAGDGDKEWFRRDEIFAFVRFGVFV